MGSSICGARRILSGPGIAPLMSKLQGLEPSRTLELIPRGGVGRLRGRNSSAVYRLSHGPSMRLDPTGDKSCARRKGGLSGQGVPVGRLTFAVAAVAADVVQVVGSGRAFLGARGCS
jgi:hypothetical protein